MGFEENQPLTIEQRAHALLGPIMVSTHDTNMRPNSDRHHLVLAVEIINLMDRVKGLERKSVTGGTATGEEIQKRNAPAAGHTAPDDAEIAELYTQIRELGRQLENANLQSKAQESLTRDYAFEIERLKAVNHVLIEAHHKELAALGSYSPGVLIDACENLFRECPIALILAAEGVSVLATLQSAMKLAKARSAAVETT